MKVLSCQLENFASYKSLDFQFDGQGLTLIQGPTGSGKSTLCDAIPWILFGTTAKNGAVTDVISWPGTDTTSGALTIQLHNNTATIVRTRSLSNKSNDLYFRLQDGPPRRGKDLRDTQELLNDLLELDADLYLAGAYYHEFSKLAQFFTTTAKVRKEICEQIVDLNLAKNLQLKATDSGRLLAEDYDQISEKLSLSDNRLNMLEKQLRAETAKRDNWQIDQERKVKDFELNKNAQIALLKEQIKPPGYYGTYIALLKHQISEVEVVSCKECGGPKHASKLKSITQEKNKAEQDRIRNEALEERLEALCSSTLPSQATENPYDPNPIEKELGQEHEILGQLMSQYGDIKTKIEDLEIIQDVIKDFRGTLIRNTLVELENNTNNLLSEYFDAEIKASFSIEDADKIEVQITKDGNVCSYTQLSKGQRCMLKLTFGISVMQTVQNHHGLELNAIFFDESLDGCDDNTKLKALRLFEKLSTNYSSVFLVEHSEAIKASIDNKYTVALVNGQSEISRG